MGDFPCTHSRPSNDTPWTTATGAKSTANTFTPKKTTSSEVKTIEMTTAQTSCSSSTACATTVSNSKSSSKGVAVTTVTRYDTITEATADRRIARTRNH